jgi:hypothetical protein
VSDRFVLNPEYAAYLPGATRLKFNHFFKDHVPLKFLVPIFLIWLPIAAYLIVYTFDLFSTDWAFKSQGIPATAQVAACEPLGAKEDRQLLRISYTYYVEGVTYKRENGTVSSAKPCEQISQQLNILYLFNNPAESRLYATTFSKTKATKNGDTLVMCALAILAVIVLEQEVVRNLNARRDLYRLRKKGTMLTGEIVHTAVKRNGKRQYVDVTYRFLTPGRDLLRRTQTCRRDDLCEAELPPRGTLVNVLYLHDGLHVML